MGTFLGYGVGNCEPDPCSKRRLDGWKGVGNAVGYTVGLALGYEVGCMVGLDVGYGVGAAVGYGVGTGVGCEDGSAVGTLVGELVGKAVGIIVASRGEIATAVGEPVLLNKVAKAISIRVGCTSPRLDVSTEMYARVFSCNAPAVNLFVHCLWSFHTGIMTDNRASTWFSVILLQSPETLCNSVHSELTVEVW